MCHLVLHNIGKSSFSPHSLLSAFWCYILNNETITTNESYSPPPVVGVVRSISIVPAEICAGVAGGVDVIEQDVVDDVVKDVKEDTVDDAVDYVLEDALDDVVDVEEVVVDVKEVVVDVEEVVEGNVAEALDDGISEEKDDVDVVFVEVIAATRACSHMCLCLYI